MKKAKLGVLLIIGLILLNIILSSWWMLNGDLMFHTDIARDFLLLEDIVVNKNISLIGPRSGAIPGVFHGPLWLYLNVPGFIIGRGDPVVVGYFWVLLSLLTVTIVYFVSRRLFNPQTALLSALLVSTLQINSIKSLFNPYGALMLAPLFVYLFWKYLQDQKITTLILCVITLGIVIQFQMAFGVPLLLLGGVVLIWHCWKKRQLWHLLLLGLVAIPLSTFIIFDLRHDFLQFRSVLNYVTGSETHGKMTLSFLDLMRLRGKEAFVDGLSIVATYNWWLIAAFALTIILTIRKLINQNITGVKTFYLLTVYFYFGFWLIALLFKGPVWSYYFWPFLPLLVIAFCGTLNFIPKTLFYSLFILIWLFNFQIAINDWNDYQINKGWQSESSWKFNRQMAEQIYERASQDFGYYIYTPDLYGYYPRYAMNYLQTINPQKKSYPYEKKAVTYLMIAPPPSYGKDPNSLWYQKNLNSSQWKVSDVKITLEPVEKVSYPNGFSVEKYNLSEKDLKIPSNPYLINSLLFR